jgi:hypothetical protein
MNKWAIQKLSSAFFIFSFLILASVSYSATVTKVFQQGTDGYTGTTDTYLDPANPATTNDVSSVNIGFFTGSTTNFHGLIKFDLSSIPTGATVSSAKLTLVLGGGSMSVGASDVVNIGVVSSAWNENQTYNMGVPSSTPSGLSVTQPSSPVVISGLGSIVQNWVSTPANNNGLMLTTTNDMYIRFQSSENGTVASRPALEVTYDVADPVLTTVVVTPTNAVAYAGLTKQFSAAGLDQFGSPMPIAFSWTVTGSENSVDSTGLVTVGSQTGTFTLTATGGGKSGSTTFQVLSGGLVTLEPAEDTYLDAANPTTDQGNKSSVNIGFFTGTSTNFHALVRFDLSSIPANATVLSSRLTFTTSGRDSVDATDILKIGLISSTWTEANTYSMGIPTYADSGVSVTQPSTNPLVISNMTSIVQGWVTNSAGNKGLIFNTTNDMYFRFQSSENATAASRPKLEIEYVLPTLVLNSVTISPANTLTGVGVATPFTATALDQFGSPLSSQPTFTWSSSGGILTGVGNASKSFTASAEGNYTVTVSATGVPSATANVQVAQVVTLQDGVNGYTGTADTYIDAIGAAATVNNGGAANISAWNRVVSSAITERRAGLIKFDLTTAGIPDGATVIAANLTMVTSKTNDVDATDALLVDKVTSSWDEGTVTWSSAPTSEASGVTAPPIGALTIGASYMITNLQNLVQAWLDAPSSNFGLRLYVDSATPKVNLSFASKEHTTLAKPALQVYYTIGAGDGDNLPDAWEIQKFGVLTYGDNDDPDGDGLTNLQEYSAGTHPAQKGDRFTVATQVLESGGNFTITWPSSPSKFYIIQFSDDLSQGWSDTLAGSIQGSSSSSTTSWTDDGNFTTGDAPGLLGKRFYRVKTQ